MNNKWEELFVERFAIGETQLAPSSPQNIIDFINSTVIPEVRKEIVEEMDSADAYELMVKKVNETEGNNE